MSVQDIRIIILVFCSFQFSCVKSDLPKACFIPHIDFVVHNVNPNTLQVTFTGITAQNGTINKHFWEFGDGSTFSGKTPPIHNYPPLSSSLPTKTYKIKYTVENDCGVAFWTKEIKVGPCLANVKFSYTYINDSTVQFTNQTNSPTQATYLWQLGDGSNNSTTSSFTKIYKTSGDFVVSLKATNGCGENFFTQTITIKKLPVLTTTFASSITSNSASSGGVITSDGGQSIISRGVCWNTSSNPTIANNKTSNGTGIGSFASTITSLSPTTTYYVRAYATNSNGTAYGNQISFTTNAPLPTITTASATSITATSAVSGGNVSNNNGSPITARGICWSTMSNPTITSNKTSNGNGNGVFSSSISGLSPNTLYYVRAYVTNSNGTFYGNEVSFVTLGYTVGSIGPAGGIVFYDKGAYSNSWRYMEVAPFDQSIGSPWGCSGSSIANASLSNIGGGITNTTSIVNSCSSSGIAAKTCDQLTLNGYSDWFLPSYSELNLVYNNLASNGLGSFSSSNYWTSTQINSTQAYIQSFSSGSFLSGSKVSSYRVRAIRIF